MSDSETFDTDLFIEAVRSLPCLWDYRTEEYSDRILKNEAWKALCKKFYEDYDIKDEEEKHTCAAQLQRKWRSLRDSFNRDLKKQSTRNSGSSKRYYYYNQLSFLKALTEKKKTTPSRIQNEDEDIKQIITEKEVTETSDSKVWKRPKIIQKSKAESVFIKKRTKRLNDRLRTQKPVDLLKACDSDMHFLLSLHDRFKNIPEDLKLNAQIDILNVIQKYSAATSMSDDNYNQKHVYVTAYEDHQYKRPSTARPRFRRVKGMQTGSKELSSLRTAIIEDMSEPESPRSVTSQASIKDDSMVMEMLESDID